MSNLLTPWGLLYQTVKQQTKYSQPKTVPDCHIQPISAHEVHELLPQTGHAGYRQRNWLKDWGYLNRQYPKAQPRGFAYYTKLPSSHLGISLPHLGWIDGNGSLTSGTLLGLAPLTPNGSNQGLQRLSQSRAQTRFPMEPSRPIPWGFLAGRACQETASSCDVLSQIGTGVV